MVVTPSEDVLPLGRIDRIGTLSWERLAGSFGGSWPSDHAGLVATLLLPGR